MERPSVFLLADTMMLTGMPRCRRDGCISLLISRITSVQHKYKSHKVTCAMSILPFVSIALGCFARVEDPPEPRFKPSLFAKGADALLGTRKRSESRLDRKEQHVHSAVSPFSHSTNKPPCACIVIPRHFTSLNTPLRARLFMSISLLAQGQGRCSKTRSRRTTPSEMARTNS